MDRNFEKASKSREQREREQRLRELEKSKNYTGYDIEENTVSTNEYTGMIPSLVIDDREAEAYEQMLNITKQIPAEQEEDKTVDGK